jgi:hypothetical protein
MKFDLIELLKPVLEGVRDFVKFYYLPQTDSNKVCAHKNFNFYALVDFTSSEGPSL